MQGDFFPDSKGWPGPGEDQKVLHFPLEQTMFAIDRATGLRAPVELQKQKLVTYSPLQVVEELFAPAPQRTVLPTVYRNRGSAKKAEELHISQEEKLERARLIGFLQKGLKHAQEEEFTL